MTPRGQQFLDRLRAEVMIGDGAVGTQLNRLDVGTDISYEQLNLTRPDIVREIMKEYLDVGAQLIETNSFCANYPKQKKFGLESQVRDMAGRAAQLGREVAGEDRFVAGSVGPLVRRKQELDEYTDDEVRGFFREAMEALVEGGADVLILETFTYLKELELALSAARGLDLPIICQMAYGEGGTTEMGLPTERAVQSLVLGGAHVIGSNCRSGPHLLVSVVERQAKVTELPISVFPNAGYAEQQDGRYVYGASPRYFGTKARELVEAGANLIGGCCGTTPEHIKALVASIQGMKPRQRQKVGKKVFATPVEMPVERKGGEKFMAFFHRPEPFVAVEIEPPRSQDVKPAIEGARMMATAGADALNVPDNTLATVKMDNVIFSRLLRERVELPIILHLTCRDKNTIALQSALLGAQTVGMESILAITGDPASIGDQPGASSVYDINSIGLVEMIASFNRGV
ncbi:MAG TPA: bifunctional homocysteine S-methyltransferase/methylenetetrahydrofolate reductase, partial [Bdellovibrionota bacterium]|nr:bifunctional homocysteine S-methyltransferase/methylenetetrahydrofolate reductase [Bdellovibrionota bacterium]